MQCLAWPVFWCSVMLCFWTVKRAKPIAAIQNLTKEKKQKTEKTPKSEKTTKQLLGEFYSDKKYLENLMKDEGTLLLFQIYTHCMFLYLKNSYIQVCFILVE